MTKSRLLSMQPCMRGRMSFRDTYSLFCPAESFDGTSHGSDRDHSLKALVWFWIIDETLLLTSILRVCRLNEVGTCQVMEQVMIMVMMVMTTR